MTEKKTGTEEELLEKLSKSEELLKKISKCLEDPDKRIEPDNEKEPQNNIETNNEKQQQNNIETNNEKEPQNNIAKLQADDPPLSERKINETKPIVTKSKKMIKKSLIFALGMICILLIAGLGGAIVYYTMKLNDKENQIDSANNTISQLMQTMADQNNTIVSSDANITNLTNEENQLQTWLIGNETLLNQTQTWLNGNVTLLLAENITSYEVQISSLNSQITQLKTWLSGNITAYQNEMILYTNEVNQYNNYVVDHHHTDEDYNATISQNANLINITSLADSIIWENNDSIQQPAGQYTNWTELANYAGYVSVQLQSSNVTGTSSVHVAVAYSAYGVSFHQEVIVSVGGKAFFPILPSNVTIFVGNDNLGFQGGASEIVTIAYFY